MLEELAIEKKIKFVYIEIKVLNNGINYKDVYKCFKR